LKPALACPNVP